MAAGSRGRTIASFPTSFYASYAEGQDIRRLVAIVGEEALTDMDKKYLAFADAFEKELVHQADQERPIEETLDLGWKILGCVPHSEYRRIRKDFIEKFAGRES